jgi:hypothetical protein
MPALALVLTGISALEQIIQVGTSAWGIIQSMKTSVTAMQAENRDPNPEEWAALNAQIKAALGQLNAP